MQPQEQEFHRRVLKAASLADASGFRGTAQALRDLSTMSPDFSADTAQIDARSHPQTTQTATKRPQ